MRNVKATWEKVVYHAGEQPLGIDALRGLVENKYAAVVLKNVLSQEIINISLEAIRHNYDKAAVTPYINGTLINIGPYLAKYLNIPTARLDDYFREAHLVDSLFPMNMDLSHYMREQLEYIFGLHSFERAAEQDGREYAPFIVRIHSEGVINTLHNDNVMRDAKSKGLLLEQLTYQLSCITCLQECDKGGELRLYQKQWNSEDEKYKIKKGIGYDSEVVKGKPCFVFKPQTGDIYLMNPTNYHQVEQVAGKDRITLGFFIGFFDRALRDAIIWS